MVVVERKSNFEVSGKRKKNRTNDEECILNKTD